MAVFLSPGVYPREIDVSILPKAIGALRPAFVGASNKGPLNEPVLITSSAQYVETFGEPFAESYLGYAVLAFLTEGASCWVLRVGVESDPGQDTDVADIAIDTSGANVDGWGRIPVFKGIDHGKIYFREVSTTDPVELHEEAVVTNEFNDAAGGDTDATLNFVTTTEFFNGCTDEVYTLTITTEPDGTTPLDGAEYIIIDSAGDEVATGTLAASSGSDSISGEIVLVAEGLTFTVEVTTGMLGINDTFVFRVQPDNNTLRVSIDGAADEVLNVAIGSYTTATDLAAAINAESPSEFEAVVAANSEGTDVTVLRTTTAGDRIQVTGTCAFAAEVGIQQYEWDIPRSYLIGTEEGPYTISTANNRIVLDIIEDEETTQFDFSVPVATGLTAESLASIIDANGTAGTRKLFDSFVLTAPGGTEHVVMVANASYQFNQLLLNANFTFIETLRFSDTIGVDFPYTRGYRSFTDARVEAPEASSGDPAIPASCADDPLSTQCSLDSDYYENIVGFFVAKYAGTWIDDTRLNLEKFTSGVGDSAGRFTVTVTDPNGVALDSVADVSFDPTATRYIANVVNDGGSIAGVTGNEYYQWEERPTGIGSDETRLPALFNQSEFDGGANGIPIDAADSVLLDNVIIGNPGLSTGLFSLQNPESYDFNLLVIPGFASGPVIATGIQFAENRGDVLYLVDPPFGLRPQQVVDWHNGMLTSDLTAAINSSYGALYHSWIKVSDSFNGGTIWIPPSGDVSAVFARTARERELWIAPAGLQRGRLLRALDIEYNPTLGERDLMYGSGNAVNPLVNFPQEGIVVWGQRTLQRTQSALDRVNVRMLLIFLKRNLQQLLRQFVFEPNDEFTRAQIRDTINPFLSDIAARRGLTAYNVVVDETNNTPERIDRNELWVSVFIKPTKAAEFIVLNLVVLRTGANFAAQEVLAAGGVVVS